MSVKSVLWTAAIALAAVAVASRVAPVRSLVLGA